MSVDVFLITSFLVLLYKTYRYVSIFHGKIIFTVNFKFSIKSDGHKDDSISRHAIMFFVNMCMSFS